MLLAASDTVSSKLGIACIPYLERSTPPQFDYVCCSVLPWVHFINVLDFLAFRRFFTNTLVFNPLRTWNTVSCRDKPFICSCGNSFCMRSSGELVGANGLMRDRSNKFAASNAMPQGGTEKSSALHNGILAINVFLRGSYLITRNTKGQSHYPLTDP